MNNNNIFNKELVYKNSIEPLVNEIKKICCKEKMPMFIAVCVSNDKTKTEYEKDVVSADISEIKLTEDIIPNLINVTLGFDTVIPNEAIDLDFE